MEAESTDPVIKQLTNKQRNLNKKLRRIQEKQGARGKELTSEERELVNSRQQVEDALGEIGRMLEQYQKFLQAPKEPAKKKVQRQETNKKQEVLDLWLVGEFLAPRNLAEVQGRTPGLRRSPATA